MKSGLEDRNNNQGLAIIDDSDLVSMKSGLEDRNNAACVAGLRWGGVGLNEVRPGRPEQFQLAATPSR